MFTGAMHSYDATSTSDQVQHSGIPGKYSFAPQSTSKRTILSSGCFLKTFYSAPLR